MYLIYSYYKLYLTIKYDYIEISRSYFILARVVELSRAENGQSVVSFRADIFFNHITNSYIIHILPPSLLHICIGRNAVPFAHDSKQKMQ